MAEPKTRPTGASVAAFLDAVENPQRRDDARVVLKLMKELSGLKAEMWGPSIIGFGRQDLTYADGRTLDWPLLGFSPRKANLVLYLMDGYDDYAATLARLGKHRTGRSCLYINKLADVDMKVLADLIKASLGRPERAASGAA
jgi:hypothetical protein